ncbi:sugar ABC transporter ATP-binding protein [Aeromicrobium camelliae]|uniref:Sugar ABC transporter ATP-binding protein n=1 Tax=Aeromicrobium camelliae TaxID=1538144 RepID=A0A3N6WP74_9ACTN|nr:sugar ABC transporter ATP-binding protein [Aeromicrobium camelliae]RQN09336.1 sugar ABC transporter ATP-binding protein [Aeromicrobium camelliae]
MQTQTDTVVADVRGLTKHYAGVKALTDADVTIRGGEVRALLGRNGAGKSTLIRLLAGVETADRGTVQIAGQPLDGGVRRAAELGVETVHQELSLVPQMTVAENMFLGAWPMTGGRVDFAAMRRGAAEVLSELDLAIDPDALVEDLPIAEQQLVEICRAVRRAPRLLILDEPTSALAAGEVAVVLATVRRVAETGVAVIYVSHRLDEIRQVATSATVMRDGRVIETVDLEDVSTRRVVELMLGDAVQEQDRPATRSVDRDATPRLSVRNLAAGRKVEDVSFDVYPGEVVGLAGLMGSGRSETLRAIAGFDPIDSGEVWVDGTPITSVTPRGMKSLGIGMTPEDRKSSAIVPLLGVDENLALADYRQVSDGPTIRWERLRAAAARLIDRLSIATARSTTPIVNLSGGNQQKAVIGRWLHAGSRVLLLDEPTRGVDVQAKEEIYRLIRELADDGAAVVFVSGELEELPLVCDRVVVVRHGRVTGEMVGEQITTDAVVAAAMTTD